MYSNVEAIHLREASDASGVTEESSGNSELQMRRTGVHVVDDDSNSPNSTTKTGTADTADSASDAYGWHVWQSDGIEFSLVYSINVSHKVTELVKKCVASAGKVIIFAENCDEVASTLSNEVKCGELNHLRSLESNLSEMDEKALIERGGMNGHSIYSMTRANPMIINQDERRKSDIIGDLNGFFHCDKKFCFITGKNHKNKHWIQNCGGDLWRGANLIINYNSVRSSFEWADRMNAVKESIKLGGDTKFSVILSYEDVMHGCIRNYIQLYDLLIEMEQNGLLSEESDKEVVRLSKFCARGVRNIQNEGFKVGKVDWNAKEKDLSKMQVKQGVYCSKGQKARYKGDISVAEQMYHLEWRLWGDSNNLKNEKKYLNELKENNKKRGNNNNNNKNKKSKDTAKKNKSSRKH